jgi:citrate synthase
MKPRRSCPYVPPPTPQLALSLRPTPVTALPAKDRASVVALLARLLRLRRGFEDERQDPLLHPRRAPHTPGTYDTALPPVLPSRLFHPMGAQLFTSGAGSVALARFQGASSPLARGPDRGIPCGRISRDVVTGVSPSTTGIGAMTEGTQLIRGLEGVVAAETRLCDLDGKNGRLAYCGYDIDDLARRATFEEVAYLLWHGELPDRAALAEFNAELIAARSIPAELRKAFALMPRQTDPMRALQAAVAMLGMHDPDATDSARAANRRKAARLTSQIATAVCAHHRIRGGQAPVEPSKELPHAANFLYMLTGQKPTDVTARAFDASLILYAEHELNASTFTTRVIAATLSDMHSAVAGGVGAMKGTLHGGAGEAVMRTLIEIGRLDNVEAFTDRALAEKRRLMGFGHRVYTAGDPRAAILKGMAEEACRQSGQGLWYDLAVQLHAKVNVAKRLIPNVDFYSAPLFYSIGIPLDLFTPVISVARVAGWTANLIEQYDDNRLIRPRADYKGAGRRGFVPLEKR